MQRLLRSPVLTRVLCDPTKDFAFNPRSMILARINRAELGEFDALVIALFLMAHFDGQLVVEDFGFYGRDTHSALIRENRLTAGVTYLDQLPERLRRSVLLVDDKIASGALYDDAVTLAKHAGLRPDPLREDNDYNKFIDAAMAGAAERPQVSPQAPVRRIPIPPLPRRRKKKPRRHKFETKGASNWSAPEV